MKNQNIMKPKKEMTQKELINKVREMHNSGMTGRQILSQLGWDMDCHEDITDILAKFGLKARWEL